MALVLPPGESPAPMNMIPASSMGMNIIPPGNMMLNSVPGENERINANDVFNSGAVDNYSNYRKAQAQDKSKTKTKNVFQHVKEHPLPPKRMRRRLAREQREKEAQDKKTTTTSSPQKPAGSVGKSDTAIGKRAMLWAQGRAQKNLEGVSVKHVIAVKPKEKGKANT